MTDRNTQTNSIALDGQHADSRAKALAPALAAILLGAFMILGVGFAHSETVHNAAHDGRHAFAFPCH